MATVQMLPHEEPKLGLVVLIRPLDLGLGSKVYWLSVVGSKRQPKRICGTYHGGRYRNGGVSRIGKGTGRSSLEQAAQESVAEKPFWNGVSITFPARSRFKPPNSQAARMPETFDP